MCIFFIRIIRIIIRITISYRGEANHVMKRDRTSTVVVYCKIIVDTYPSLGTYKVKRLERKGNYSYDLWER